MTDHHDGLCTHPCRESAGVARSRCADCGVPVCFACGRTAPRIRDPDTGELTYTRTCGNAVCMDQITQHYE